MIYIVGEAEMWNLLHLKYEPIAVVLGRSLSRILARKFWIHACHILYVEKS
jgi:hypothetical protein